MGGATSKLDENDWELADGKLASRQDTIDGAFPVAEYAVYYIQKRGINQREFDVSDQDQNLLYSTRSVPGTIACFDVIGRGMGEDLLRITVDLARRYWIVYRYNVPSFPGQKPDMEATDKVAAEYAERQDEPCTETPFLFKKCCITVSWSRYMAVSAFFGPPTVGMLMASPTNNNDDGDDESGEMFGDDSLFQAASKITHRMVERTASDDRAGEPLSPASGSVSPSLSTSSSKLSAMATVINEDESGGDKNNTTNNKPQGDEPSSIEAQVETSSSEDPTTLDRPAAVRTSSNTTTTTNNNKPRDEEPSAIEVQAETSSSSGDPTTLDRLAVQKCLNTNNNKPPDEEPSSIEVKTETSSSGDPSTLDRLAVQSSLKTTTNNMPPDEEPSSIEVQSETSSNGDPPTLDRLAVQTCLSMPELYESVQLTTDSNTPDELPSASSADESSSLLSSPSRHFNPLLRSSFTKATAATTESTRNIRSWIQTQSQTIREKSQHYIESTKNVKPSDPLEGVIQLDGPLLLCQEIYNRIIGNHQTSLVSKETVLELLREDMAQHLKEHPEDAVCDDADDPLLSAEGLALSESDDASPPQNGTQEAKTKSDESIGGTDESINRNNNNNETKEKDESGIGSADTNSSDNDNNGEQPLVGYFIWENTLRIHKMKLHVAKGTDLALHVVLAVIANQVRYERNAIALTV